jgi:antitoxin (DNA-binding transcriptional repressor) of toxin-antitoxin stability system
MDSRDQLGIPHETLNVSQARYHFTRLLRRLRTQSRVYMIMQRGKPVGALISLDWLKALLRQSRSKRPFSLFGQATVARDWERTLAELRSSLKGQTVGRYPSRNR